MAETTTTSRKEWEFVNAVDSSPHFPKEGKARDDSKWRPREHKPLSDYNSDKMKMDLQLVAVGMRPLTDEELVGDGNN